MSNDELKELAREGLFQSIAHANLGIYCAAVTQEDGVLKKRDAYGDGWNAAVFKSTENYYALEKWFSGIEQKDQILDLLVKEKLSVRVSKDGCALYVNCNDLFYWATADAENITTEEIPELMECLGSSPDHGELLWCCKKRGMRPQSPYYKYFAPEEQALFDACGPRRDGRDE